MIDGQIATLPIQPNDPWFRFVDSFDSIPFKPKLGKHYKEIPANTRIFGKGIVLSITMDDLLFTLRATFDDSYKFLVGPELVGDCVNAGWSYHSKAPGSLLFRKEVNQKDKSENVASEFIPILTLLGVDPNQDWGI
jgi:hypothetical protein